MFQKKIRTWFRSCIHQMPASQLDSELRNILLHEKHPMLENFFNNMAVELPKAAMTRRAQGKNTTNEQFKWLTEEMTKVFVMGLQNEARRRYETDIEKFNRQREADRIKEYDAVIDGKPIGEFAEAGVITNEALDAEREESL